VSDSQHDKGLTPAPASDEEVRAGIGFLQAAIEGLLRGYTRSFSLVEIDEEGRARRSMITLDGAHLDKLADVLHQQSVVASHVSARWQGNAPPNSRSYRQH
jgi:hypothetical protein